MTDDGRETLLAALYTPQESEEAQAERLRLLKGRKALQHAAELVEHLRALMLPSDGRTEQGEWHRVKRTPLITGITDAADEVYVVILEWVGLWAAELQQPAPLAAVAAWRTRRPGEVANIGGPTVGGFRAGTSPTAARGAVQVLVSWLLDHEDAIAAHALGGEFFDEVSRVVWKHRAQSGLTEDRRSRIRVVAARPCPECGEDAVHGEFFGGGIEAAVQRGERLSPYARPDESPEQALNAYLQAIAGVDVRCEVCGWRAAPRPSQLARWLA